MLHLIFQSPIGLAVIERIDGGDDVVFQECAVWHVMRGHVLNTQLSHLMDQAIRLHVLQDELEVNGIGQEQLLAGVVAIDYSGLVELTVNNKVIKTWC